ncbi:hypothetical protein E2C01_054318 [Portunus trituberculatus]|uniref:Uncharacterized protein n=1 Tax=Portunus trituberculatus TaxID=210409 RepID=A0A5B7GRP3_PORTR|nr:hypothetical protein [Portunus trituberculatus]
MKSKTTSNEPRAAAGSRPMAEEIGEEGDEGEGGRRWSAERRGREGVRCQGWVLQRGWKGSVEVKPESKYAGALQVTPRVLRWS